MSRIFNIEHKKAHRAIDDAKATAELLLVYLSIFIEKKIAKINHLYYPKNRYELDRKTFKKGSKGHWAFLKSLATPHLITVKGENGIILLAYPNSNLNDEIEFLRSQIKDLPWTSITVKLYGDFLEAFINYLPHFQKMSQEVRQETLSTLYKKHLNRQPPVNGRNKDPLTVNQEKDKEKKTLGDFVIVPHLVPEQINIFPIHLPQHKQQLTFRYPAHQKKLLQYINSKSARLDKQVRGRLSQNLADFYYEYLGKRKENNGQSIMLFSRNLPQKMSDRFFIEIDEFQVNNITKYRYPKDYI
jgi:DNA polymerase-3 subunit alpha (Gram-positive type)